MILFKIRREELMNIRTLNDLIHDNRFTNSKINCQNLYLLPSESFQYLDDI